VTAVTTSGRRPLLAVAALLLVLAGCGRGAASAHLDPPLLVAGAADLQPAFTELGASFEAATGIPVTFSFGSSGQLAQQIIEGAPVDLYASASGAFVDQVLAAGAGDAHTRVTYAFGRIAVWSPEEAWGGWRDLAELAADPAVGTIAIANPEHAPYGLAARQAFIAAGVWGAVEPRLVYGENIADTQRLSASGNADAAVIALSLAIAADEGEGGRWVLVDDALHEPLQQDLVVVAGDPERAAAAGRFAAHVGSEHGRSVMRRLGFVLPDDAVPDGSGG
jgi:molybdate transport system substrate-binding protein